MIVLLVNPWITDFAAFDFWDKPLGLLYLGSFLRNRGDTVTLIDCMDRFHPDGDTGIQGRDCSYGTGKFHADVIPTPEVVRHVPRRYRRYGIPEPLFRTRAASAPAPDVILVTCIMTYWYPGAQAAIAILSEIYPDTPILLGGIYTILCPEHARNNAVKYDALISNDIRYILDYISCITCAEHDSDNIGEFPDWPYPTWELYSVLRTASVLTTRGCPMSCTVCASRRLFDGFYRRPTSSVLSELSNLADRGVRDVAFSDDALLLSPETHALPLFEEIADARLPIRLHTPNGLHVREITPAVARAMKQAGIRTVRLSLETSSPDRAADFSGKVSRDDFSRAATALFDAGFTSADLGAYVLAGLPGQTKEEVAATAVFAHGCGVPVKPALFSPVPGTVMFERAVEAGMIAPDDDPLLHNNTLRTVDWWKDGPQGYARFREMVSRGNHRLTGNHTV